MAHDDSNARQLLELQHTIQEAITHTFAPEDEGLRSALVAAKEAGLPEIQISPLQGKLLQFLATVCHAKKILEIGSLAGYSGIWLARSLPADGRLITLEIDPKHAEVVRQAFARAGVGDRTEVRVGKAADLLPQLKDEAPFDLVFIDADKPPYPEYLDWALRYTRPGSIIVADNCIRQGQGFTKPTQQDAPNVPYNTGIFEYNQRIVNNPHLLSLALAIDDDNTDGFTIATVL